jgi:hypothetical protein
MAPVEYKICYFYAEKSASLSMLKCANNFRRINQSYSNFRVCKSFAGLYSRLLMELRAEQWDFLLLQHFTVHCIKKIMQNVNFRKNLYMAVL